MNRRETKLEERDRLKWERYDEQLAREVAGRYMAFHKKDASNAARCAGVQMWIRAIYDRFYDSLSARGKSIATLDYFAALHIASAPEMHQLPAAVRDFFLKKYPPPGGTELHRDRWGYYRFRSPPKVPDKRKSPGMNQGL